MKDPYLKIKYTRGLGDLIACILHSKLLGWITYLIIKSKTPCNKCTQRRDALNIIFPLPLWKLFFKSEEDYILSLKLELEELGHEVTLTRDGKGLSSSKIDIKEEDPEQEEYHTPNYILMSSSETIIGDFLIKTEIYKNGNTNNNTKS